MSDNHECDQCKDSPDILYLKRGEKIDNWYCLKCFTGMGEKVICYSCEEGFHEPK
jgi:hypothetical protein